MGASLGCERCSDRPDLSILADSRGEVRTVPLQRSRARSSTATASRPAPGGTSSVRVWLQPCPGRSIPGPSRGGPAAPPRPRKPRRCGPGRGDRTGVLERRHGEAEDEAALLVDHPVDPERQRAFRAAGGVEQEGADPRRRRLLRGGGAEPGPGAQRGPVAQPHLDPLRPPRVGLGRLEPELPAAGEVVQQRVEEHVEAHELAARGGHQRAQGSEVRSRSGARWRPPSGTATESDAGTGRAEGRRCSGAGPRVVDPEPVDLGVGLRRSQRLGLPRLAQGERDRDPAVGGEQAGGLQEHRGPAGGRSLARLQGLLLFRRDRKPSATRKRTRGPGGRGADAQAMSRSHCRRRMAASGGGACPRPAWRSRARPGEIGEGLADPEGSRFGASSRCGPGSATVTSTAPRPASRSARLARASVA